MYLINNGHIMLPKNTDKETVNELLKMLHEAHIIGDDYDEYFENEPIMRIEIDECYGDIEGDLLQIVSYFADKGILLNGEIEYIGDYEGTYCISNGKFETLSEEEKVLRNFSTKELYQELTRRGIKFQILPKI